MTDMRQLMLIVESAGHESDIPRFIMPSGTLLYHGTESRTDFRLPRAPAWFTTDKQQAARWAGWRASDRNKGKRRVLSFRTTRDMDLFDARHAENYYKLATIFDPENEPEDGSPWTMAANLTGADGWYGGDEVLLRNLAGLEPVTVDPVPKSVKSFGTP